MCKKKVDSNASCLDAIYLSSLFGFDSRYIEISYLGSHTTTVDQFKNNTHCVCLVINLVIVYSYYP